MGAPGVLTVSLGAIVANWRLLCALHPGQAVAGVMKADAYGLGAEAVAPALHAAGCRHFFVAMKAEGQALRRILGPGPMIAVLDGFAPDPEADVTPVLNSLADVAAWRGLGHAALLNIDTGMARLGLEPAEQARLMAEPERLAGIDLRYVMTHLACADDPAHPLNARQRDRFAAFRLAGVARSLAASSAMFLGPDFVTDLARPGAALYGLNPTPGRPNPMRAVVTLQAPILQLRHIPAGTSVGYGATWVSARDSRIATVAAGYADGYLRGLSGRAWAMLAGARVPLVGRVSMDLLTFDVTDAPEPAPGAMITLIGPGVSADELGLAGGTIGYEMLTGLGQRYHRVWAAA